MCTNGVEPLYYIARITPYYDTAGKISGVVATLIDVSSLARSEEYVHKLHADRLSSMAEMATGLAHELNQPLSAIATYLKAIRRLLRDRELAQRLATAGRERVVQAFNIEQMARKLERLYESLTRAS